MGFELGENYSLSSPIRVKKISQVDFQKSKEWSNNRKKWWDIYHNSRIFIESKNIVRTRKV